MASTITWRVYRSEAAAPAPILRKEKLREVYSFIPEHALTGDTVLVEAFTRAEGLYTGRVWLNSASLPSQVLRDEPVLLELKQAYGSRLIKLAVANGFVGDGPNPYFEPRVMTVDGTPHVLVASHPREDTLGGEVIDTGDETLRTFPARWLGRKAYQIPAGFSDLHYIAVAGELYEGAHDYDPYHGVVYLDEVTEGQRVSITIRNRFRMTRPIETQPNAVTPVYVRGTLFGHLAHDLREQWADARRMPKVASGARVGNLYYDGEPIATGHLWVIEAPGADPDRIASAVRKTMPAGTLYRLTDSYTPPAVDPLSPATGETVVSPVTFRWEAFEEALYYHLQVSRTEDFSEVEVDTTSLTALSYEETVMSAGVPLYWRIRAYDGYGMTAWSTPVEFEASGTTQPGFQNVQLQGTDGTWLTITTSDGKIYRLAR